MYKYLLCWRYLKTRYIALASVVSVMLGVATMIVVNAVMAGFAEKMRDRLHGVLADVVIESYSLNGFYHWEEVMARVREVERLGAHSVYLHYGADQRRADATKDSTQWAKAVGAAVRVPLGCGCFGVEDGVRAAALGADVIVIGHPLISGPDPLGALKEFCEKVRAAYKPRPSLQLP